MKESVKAVVLITCVLMGVLNHACTKENGKHEYILRLAFSSGDVWEETTLMHEKTENIFNKESYKGSKNLIYLDFKYLFYLIKVENRFFVGANNIEMKATDFNMINGQSGNIQGRIEMEGEYKRHLRAYFVEDGTFKFFLAGSPFNVSDTIYTGKWSLKRKE